MASFVSRVADHPPERWLSSREVFRAMSEGGAKALGFGGVIGRIEKGYKADSCSWISATCTTCR